MTDDQRGVPSPAESHNAEQDARRQEILHRFRELPPENARKQVEVLPYYHQLENEIIKPNQGVWTTRYFRERWRPVLGSEAASIIEALRLLADKNGETFASQPKIAELAGVSLRTLKRYLSTNEEAVSAMSDAWKEQWRLLHGYFLKVKTPRYRLQHQGNQTRARRTTSLYQVAMDDPIHPDDEGQLFVKAAERIIRDEYPDARKPLENRGVGYKGQNGPHRKSRAIIERPEPDPNKGQNGPHHAGPEWPSLSLSDRSNAINVKASNAGLLTETSFRADPRVSNLSIEEREQRDALAFEIGEWLLRKAGKDSTKPHKSAGFHRRVAYFVPEELVRQVMRDLEDRMADAREGRKLPLKDLSAAFGGFVSRVCQQKGIDLIPRPEKAVQGQ